MPKAPLRRATPATPATPAKRGRPQVYTPALAEEILRRVAAGEPLLQICRTEGIPDRDTILRWTDPENTHTACPDPEFGGKYARAKLAGFEAMSEQMLEIAADGRNDWMEREGGGQQLDYEHVARSKLRVETLKWTLAKRMPHVFGDRIIQEHTGPGGGPLQIQVMEAIAEGRARVAALRQPAQIAALEADDERIV